MSFFTGFGVSSLVYYGLNMAFPVRGAHKVFHEVDVSEGVEDSAGTSEVDEDEKYDIKGDEGVQHTYAAA